MYFGCWGKSHSLPHFFIFRGCLSRLMRSRNRTAPSHKPRRSQFILTTRSGSVCLTGAWRTRRLICNVRPTLLRLDSIRAVAYQKKTTRRGDGFPLVALTLVGWFIAADSSSRFPFCYRPDDPHVVPSFPVGQQAPTSFECGFGALRVSTRFNQLSNVVNKLNSSLDSASRFDETACGFQRRRY